jgi:hypothetical protein
VAISPPPPISAQIEITENVIVLGFPGEAITISPITTSTTPRKKFPQDHSRPAPALVLNP